MCVCVCVCARERKVFNLFTRLTIGIWGVVIYWE